VEVFRFLLFAFLAFLLSQLMDSLNPVTSRLEELAVQAAAWLLLPLLLLELRIRQERSRRLTNVLQQLFRKTRLEWRI